MSKLLWLLAPFRHAIAGMLLLSACNTSSPATEAPFARPSAAPDCWTGRQSLVALNGKAESVRPSISYEDAMSERLRIEYVKTLTGSCASAVDEALMDVVRLPDGRVYRVGNEGAEELPTRSPSFADVKGLTKDKAPRLRGAPLLAWDDYMSDSGAGEHRFVGLWNDGGRWTVATFTTRNVRDGGKPRELFHSSLPLRSLVFFPSVDTPAGQIWIVQEGPAKEVRVIAVHWRHERASEPHRS